MYVAAKVEGSALLYVLKTGEVIIETGEVIIEKDVLHPNAMFTCSKHINAYA